MTDAEVLELHRAAVAVPSVSRSEGALCDLLESRFRERGLGAERFGQNLYSVGEGDGPTLCLASHLDTVPPGPGWSRPPFEPTVEDGRVYGLGSNDAKASVAAMVAAFVRLAARPVRPGVRVVLALLAQEETGGAGAEALVPELRRRGLAPAAVIVGEPTGLDVAVAQKGLMVIDLRTHGRACHAANAGALGAENALRLLAADIVALERADLGPPHPLLGPVTVEPTVVSGGTARNMVPGEAGCILDVRTNPGQEPGEIVERLRRSVRGRVDVLSDRLRPCGIDPDHVLVRAALRARPGARAVGSRGVSDLVFFDRIPGIKVGPGATERSHTPDEYVLESEILEGARFYEGAALAYGSMRAGE